VSEFTYQLLTSSLTSAGFTAFLAYLIRGFLSNKIKRQIQYEYDLKLDSHKSELLKASNLELEQLKNSLKISEIKSNIQLSHLHEKQAERIENIHQYMWELFLALNDYTTVFQARKQTEKDEKRNIVADKLKELKSYHRLNSIFISKELSDIINSITKDIYDTALDFMDKVEQQKGKDMNDEWDAIHKKVNTQIKSGIDDLANEFRVLLGAS